MWVSVGIIPGPDIGELQSLPVKPMLQEHPPRLLHICKQSLLHGIIYNVCAVSLQGSSILLDYSSIPCSNVFKKGLSV